MDQIYAKTARSARFDPASDLCWIGDRVRTVRLVGLPGNFVDDLLMVWGIRTGAGDLRRAPGQDMFDDIGRSLVDSEGKVMECKRIEAETCAFAGDKCNCRSWT